MKRKQQSLLLSIIRMFACGWLSGFADVSFHSGFRWPCLILMFCETAYTNRRKQGLAMSSRPVTNIRGFFSSFSIFTELFFITYVSTCIHKNIYIFSGLYSSNGSWVTINILTHPFSTTHSMFPLPFLFISP